MQFGALLVPFQTLCGLGVSVPSYTMFEECTRKDGVYLEQCMAWFYAGSMAAMLMNVRLVLILSDSPALRCAI